MSTIQALHDSHWRGVFHITGGGASLFSALLAVPGASRSLLDASIPYAEQALADLLGTSPEQAVSQATARALAMAAYQRAVGFGGANHFGLGCTASLVTDRTKRGQTRAHWAIQTVSATHEYYLELDAARSRSEQETALREALIASLGEALLGDDDAGLQSHVGRAIPQWQPLLGMSPYRWCSSHGQGSSHSHGQGSSQSLGQGSGQNDGSLILPGSFNPVHDGHYQMLALAEEITGKIGAFELTLRNADKPDLDYLSVQERLANITDRRVWLTNQANFSAKAELFPGATFVLGTDTMARIGELRFYQNSTDKLAAAIERLQALDIRFLVLGRALGDDFVSLDDLTLPSALLALCEGVPESTYRNDVSSSSIRAKRALSKQDAQG
ncbi:MAG: CinA family protein [Pseudomonadales bacterium]|nr:CinA family protein [Pseudomonadales bacterium]